ARRYALDPRLSDGALVDLLAVRAPDLDAEALRRLLAETTRTQVTENELLRIIAEVDEWIKQLP
ncbi:MAG: hypothetical protein HC915_03625, partial [Anaerolineae bacterium]|nr:hypothetical protein [Anaerolineae bacterium]